MGTITVVMGETEARALVLAIQTELGAAEKHFIEGERRYTRARELLYKLHEYEGWKALGYGSWRQCVKAEFHKSQATLYNQLAAAAIEQQISTTGGIGSIPERVLRPLARKHYSAETNKMLWEVAKQVTGAEASITSGTINAVIEVLEEAIVTGTLQDEQGEQHSVFERIKVDTLARTIETRKRQQQHIQSKAGEKVLSAIEAIPSEDDPNSVLLRITGAITPQQRKTLLNAKKGVKVTVWLD